jgi:hypothetical protein
LPNVGVRLDDLAPREAHDGKLRQVVALHG